MRRIAVASAMILTALATAVAGASTKGTTLNLVAYSTPKTVMGKIVQAWQQTPDGSGNNVNAVYGPSTDQARAVAAGLKADLVFLSTGDDVNTLVDAGLVDKNWQKQQTANGDEADSVVVFAFRGGNPKHIKTWNDLVRPGVQVVTPNPFSSGSAKWNVLAAYAAARAEGKPDKRAQAFVLRLFKNVVSQDSSGRNATNTFLAGKGDVLLTYESEAYTAKAAGKDLQIISPKQTMLIQLPMVPLKTAPTKATAFIKYCHSYGAQKLFTQAGYRPVIGSVLKNPALKAWKARFNIGSHLIFSIKDKIFGGWGKANNVWFSPNGRMMTIEKAVGGPTS